MVETVNQLMLSPEWDTMAIIIAYDDSDGWYDHVMPPCVNESQTAYDFLTAPDTKAANRVLTPLWVVIKGAIHSALECR